MHSPWRKFIDRRALDVNNGGMAFHPEQAFAEIARGDAVAKEFMLAFYAFVHTLDDLYDRDKPLSPEVAVWPSLHLMAVLGPNSFFARHHGVLMPVILASTLSWIASEDRRQSPDALARIEAQVWKGSYADVFFTVASLVGGFDHALQMSRKYREVAYDAEPAKVV